MPRRFDKLIWVLLAALFAGQSLLPLAALAEVTVRCAGAPASSAPCAHDMLDATDTAAVTRRLVSLPCCRTMASCTMVMASSFGLTSTQILAPGIHRFSGPAPKCLVTITLLDTKPATLSPQTHRWLLGSAPAFAPPLIRPDCVTPSTASQMPFSAASFHLPASVTPRSHAPRGPPCA